MKALFKLICPVVLLLACNNQAAEKSALPENDSLSRELALMDDSIPVEDTLSMVIPVLDENRQMQLFKVVLKDVKAKKLNDFSQLRSDKLLSTYTNLEKTLQSYVDSSLGHHEFFSRLFRNLETHEEILGSDTLLDVKTKLEIARVKTHIRKNLAGID